MADERDDSPWGRGYGTGWALVGAGFQLAFSIVFFMGMGYLVDRWLGMRPLFMLIGLALGMATGFYAFWMRVQAASKGGPR
jgi:F0F1-type ATP synthase assembly protein I